MIIAVGIRWVVAYRRYHAAADTREMFSAANIEMRIIVDEVEQYPEARG